MLENYDVIPRLGHDRSVSNPVRSHFMRGLRSWRARIIQNKFSHKNKCKVRGILEFALFKSLRIKWKFINIFFASHSFKLGQAVAYLVEALCYKPESRGFDFRWGHWIFFNWLNLSSRSMALGSTQPLTEMSTTNLPAGKGRPVLKPDNLTANSEPIFF
jgi:hypothetical protein